MKKGKLAYGLFSILCSFPSPFALADSVIETKSAIAEFEGPTRGIDQLVWEPGPFDIHTEQSKGGELHKVTLKGTHSLVESAIAPFPEQEFSVEDGKDKNGAKIKRVTASFLITGESTPIKIQLVNPDGELELQTFTLIQKTVAKLRWEKQVELNIPFGFYTENRWGGAYANTDLFGNMFGLAVNTSIYKAITPEAKALEGGLSGAVAYMLPINGSPIPLPWSVGLFGALRNQWRMGPQMKLTLSPFLGVQGQHIPIMGLVPVTSVSGLGTQIESIHLLWVTLGTRIQWFIPKHSIQVSPVFSFAPITRATLLNSGDILSHTAWTLGIKATASLWLGFYGGVDFNYLTMSGDSQISSIITNLLIGYRF